MKIAVFAVEYTVKDLGWGRDSIPPELRPRFRMRFFYELVKQTRNQRIDLVILPGGFFRTDSPNNIAYALENHPPNVKVLVGRDNVKGSKCESWVIAPNGSITKRIPEAWIYKKESKRQAVLNRLTDRRFQFHNEMYTVFCCGDVLIDTRKTPIIYSKAAFVLAHYSTRRFAPSMCKLGIPTFLSHHVKDPYNTINYAYNGKKKYPIAKIFKGKFQILRSKELRWLARVYFI